MAKEVWEDSSFGNNSVFHPNWAAKQQQQAQQQQALAATPSSAPGKVYLTFDDGLQLGTKEALQVLDDAQVRGTFFLTGIHVKSFIEKTSKAEGLALLRRLYTQHFIGNHSYAHANDYYDNFYEKGLKVGKKPDGSFIFRSVLEDFKLNDRMLNKYLAQAGIKIAADYQHKFARFPGRNTWKTKALTELATGTEQEAKDLFKAGYSLFGWDVEWKMDFQLAPMSRDAVRQKNDAGTLNWNSEEDTHPFYNLCDRELAKKDRLTGTWAGVSDDIEDYMYRSRIQPFDAAARTDKKVVLLMHERAFRQCGEAYKSESQKLAALINSLKKKGFTFDTINNY